MMMGMEMYRSILVLVLVPVPGNGLSQPLFHQTAESRLRGTLVSIVAVDHIYHPRDSVSRG
jgi:hypothetical protein